MAAPPPGYHFAPSLTPQPFMGLSKFITGRIHQMRSGKSYLAVHLSLFNRDLPSTCPRCWAAPEIFEHAILHCRSRSRLKELYLPWLNSLDTASPIWSSYQYIAFLAKFIITTTIRYPPDMFPHSPQDSHASPPPSPFCPIRGFLPWKTTSILGFFTYFSGQLRRYGPWCRTSLLVYDVFSWLVTVSWFSYARKNWLLRVFLC